MRYESRRPALKGSLHPAAAALLVLFAPIAHAVDCSTASGPREVLECEAKFLGYASGAELWKNKLFNPLTLDGACQKALPDGATVVATQLYALACGRQKGSYFSFDSFVAADEELKARLGNDYQFMREGSISVKLQELANLLATASQETSGNGLLATRYQQDGLYYRYEKPEQCFLPKANPKYLDAVDRTVLDPNVCAAKDVGDFVTGYYPFSTFVVAVQDGTGLVDTEFISDQDCQYDLRTPYASFRCWDGGSMRPTVIGGNYPPPAGYRWQFMNQIVPPGYYIGMGNLQLTGDVMIKFFGWYHQNMAAVRQKNADPKAFVDEYLGNGKLAWIGGLWYWNFRSNGMLADGSGKPKPTLHQVLTGSKEACHDIGITTVLVNDTKCNDTPGRTAYYNYYKTNVFKLSGTPVMFVYDGATYSSMACSAAILGYCTK